MARTLGDAVRLRQRHWSRSSGRAIGRVEEILIARGVLSGLEVERLWRDFTP
jgi:hypothetical protein